MTIVSYAKNMPAWARWMLYAVVGVAVLNIVQGFDDTSLLTAEGHPNKRKGGADNNVD